MTELWGNFIGICIVIMIISFLGGWAWLWRKSHKPLFDSMASLPMKDSDEELVRFEEEHR